MNSVFEELVPEKWFDDDHRRKGGRNLRMFVAAVPGGFLRVLLADEPMRLNPPRDYERHLSLSFAERQDRHTTPTRRPTAEEVRDTLDFFSAYGEFAPDGFDGPEKMVLNFWAPIQ